MYTNLSLQVCEYDADVGDHDFWHQRAQLGQEAGEGLHPRALTTQLLTGLLANLPGDETHMQNMQSANVTSISIIWL